MDSITHMLLGASLQGSLLGRYQGRRALLYGALLATLPDLDVLLPFGDDVDRMTGHRSFSHSVLLLSGLAALLAWLIRHAHGLPDCPRWRLLASLWLVLVSHPLLDAFTSYGTQLLWPLPLRPVAWSSIFVIDPLYSLPLLAGVLLAARSGTDTRGLRALQTGLLLSTLYLGFTLAGKQMAEQRVQQVLKQQGIRDGQLFSSPTPFNSLLWRVMLVKDDHDYEALTGWLDRQPPRLLHFSRHIALAAPLQGSTQQARLQWFSGGLLRYDVMDGLLVVTDLRLGLPGLHSFRFPLAMQGHAGWQCLPYARRLAGFRGGFRQLQQLLSRILDEQATLPLEQWARDSHEI